MYDLNGQRFGRWLVLGRDEASGGEGNEVRWHCVCGCGTTSSVRSYPLRKGHSISCGCAQQRSGPIKHGKYNSRTYHTWEGMKQRCLNPAATRYPSYGAIGVSVCERWSSFENFYSDMGERPIGKTLDRINPFGNYEPSNCRWADLKTQANNTRRKYTPEEVTSPC